MKKLHKVCKMCNEELPVKLFKTVKRKGGKYLNSYCNPCEKQRHIEYNRNRPRRPGVEPIEVLRARRAEAKQKRLAELSAKKQERKKIGELKRQEKLRQEEINKQLRSIEGKAKWDAWYAEYSCESNIAKLKEEARAKATAEREERLATGVKTCTSCKEELPLHRFHSRTRKRKDGSSYTMPFASCKDCRRIDNRKHEQTSETLKASKKRNRVLRDRRSKQATPRWLTDEQKQQIVDTYEHMRDCRAVIGEDYHVDHIVPLRGEGICGLHVPWNLQVLPAYVNIAKSNTHCEDPPMDQTKVDPP